jgi:hypothetical protein
VTSKRTRVVGLAATLASIPFLLPTAAGANAGNGYVDSSDDPNSYPPLPGDCAGGQLWWQWVGDPNAQPLAASNPYLVLPMSVPAGEVSVPEAITWDARYVEDVEDEPEYEEQQPEIELDALSAYSGDWAESNESMRVEFYKDGTFLGATPYFTPDLLDDNPYAWSVSDLGTVVLEEDANQVVLKHASTFMDTDGTDNWFLPKSICVTSTPIVVPTTTVPTTTVAPVGPKPAVALANDCDSATITMTNSGDQPGEVSYGIGADWTTVTVNPGETMTKDVTLTEDESTYIEAWANDQQVVAQILTPDCQPEAQVLAQTETAEPELAFTGSDTTRNTGIGAALLAAGIAMLGFSRRRRAEA